MGVGRASSLLVPHVRSGEQAYSKAGQGRGNMGLTWTRDGPSPSIKAGWAGGSCIRLPSYTLEGYQT